MDDTMLSLDLKRQVNEDNCLKILYDNRFTEYGKKYAFESIGSADEFRRKVPLADYGTFSPYIERMMNGEKDVLTAYDVFGFCYTSGTTGGIKYIPASRETFNRYKNYFEIYQDSVIERFGGRKLHLNIFRCLPFEPVKKPFLLSEIYYRNMAELGYTDYDTYIGGKTLMFCEEPGDIVFAKAWVSFIYSDITVLEANFLYDQLYFFDYLEKNYKTVLESIRNGRIPPHIELSPRISEYLLSLGYDEERLEQVERECEKGFDDIALRLWSGLKLISGISNKAFFSEDKALKRYAPDVPRYYLCYASSECHMGHPVKEDDFGYILLPDNAFYEFLPYGSESSDTLLPHELRVGQRYEIICTTFSGLYRYCMGDIVEVWGFRGDYPIIEFCFRKNHMLNIAGEKMELAQIEDAVRELSASGVRIEQYCFSVSVEKLPVRYLAVLSLRDTGQDADQTADRLDRTLREKNCDYDDLREIKSLERLDVLILNGVDYERFMTETGIKTGHNKPKHIASEGRLERSFYIWKEMRQKRKDGI